MLFVGQRTVRRVFAQQYRRMCWPARLMVDRLVLAARWCITRLRAGKMTIKNGVLCAANWPCKSVNENRPAGRRIMSWTPRTVHQRPPASNLGRTVIGLAWKAALTARNVHDIVPVQILVYVAQFAYSHQAHSSFACGAARLYICTCPQLRTPCTIPPRLSDNKNSTSLCHYEHHSCYKNTQCVLRAHNVRHTRCALRTSTCVLLGGGPR